MRKFTRGLLRVARSFFPGSLEDLLRIVPLSGILVFVWYSAIADTRPLNSVQSFLLTPVVEQGGFFRLSYTMDWGSNCVVVGQRYVIDSAGRTTIYNQDRRRVSRGSDSYVVELQVPAEAALGTASYRGIIIYKCNWFQQFFPLERTIVSRDFEIVRPSDTPTLPASAVSACPPTSPVLVRQHCRALPNTVMLLDVAAEDADGR